MTPDVEHRDVLMYINSLKVLRILPPDEREAALSAVQNHGHYTLLPMAWAGRGGLPDSRPITEDEYANKPVMGEEITDEESDVIRLVLQSVHTRGKRLHIVDVGRESGFHRYIAEHLHHLSRYPVLVRPDGRRLEGTDQFTPERLAAFLTD